MIKLIAIDLDGTLLTDDKQLPPDFWEIADKLFKRQISIVIASGRPYHNIVNLFEPIKDNLIFACDNGTFVAFREKELLVNALDKNAISGFIETARTIENVYPVLCGKDIAFIENTNEVFTANALKYYQEFNVVDDLRKVKELILKLSLCDLNGSEENSYPHFKKHEKDFSVAVAGEIWLDITNINGTKGNAIKKVQEHFNISAAETLAFGDYLNDLDMIKNAGFSYAMKNAHPKIIESAKNITTLDNNHFGVTETLKELLLV